MSNSNKNKVACYELINNNDFYGKAGRRIGKQQFNLLPNKHKDLFTPIYIKNFSKDKYDSKLVENFIIQGDIVEYFVGLDENNNVEVPNMDLPEDGDNDNADYEENFF